MLEWLIVDYSNTGKWGIHERRADGKPGRYVGELMRLHKEAVEELIELRNSQYEQRPADSM